MILSGLTGPDLVASWFRRLDRGSRPALVGYFYLQVYISPPTTFGDVSRITTIGAQGRR